MDIGFNPTVCLLSILWQTIYSPVRSKVKRFTPSKSTRSLARLELSFRQLLKRLKIKWASFTLKAMPDQSACFVAIPIINTIWDC